MGTDLRDITEERWDLLEQNVPQLQYDSQAAYRAMSAASMTENPGNRLVQRTRALRRDETIASASGAPVLSLDLLADYPPGQEARRGDRLKHAGDPLRAAAAMQHDPRYEKRVYGRAVRDEHATYLQFWLWLYWVPRDAVGILTGREGAWRVVQIELGEDEKPVRIRLPSGEVRAWEGSDGENPVIYVSPFRQMLYLDGGIKRRIGVLSDGCDGKGVRETPKLERFGKWVDWPGTWGDSADPTVGDRRSPALQKVWRKPRAHTEPSRLMNALARGVRLLPMYKEPGPPSLDARLERGRVVVRYSLTGGRSSTLYLTVHRDRDGEVVAAAAVQSRARTGEEAIALPSALDQCELRASCTSPLEDRGIAKPVLLAANEPDELERTILGSVRDEQLRADRIDEYAAMAGKEPHELREEMREALLTEESRARVWQTAASDLQEFRDARTQVARERLARRALARSWVDFARAAAMVLVLLVVTAVLLAVVPDANVLAPVIGMVLGAGFSGGVLLTRSAYRRRSAAKARLRELHTEGGRAGRRHLDDASLADARGALEDALREKGVAPALREYVNELNKERYGLRLAMSDEGNPDDRAREHEVPTEARTRLEMLTERMRGGSIGIAGPRGVGKTTLIEAFSQPRDTNDRRLTVVLAAPVHYDAREFVLTMFGQLCARVLGSEGGLAPADVAQVEWGRRWLRRYLGGLVGAAIAVVLAVVGEFAGGPARVGLFVLAAAALVLGFLHTWASDRRRRRAAAGAPLADLERRLRERADEALKEVRFQQSFSQGYSGKLTLPIGAEVGKDVRRDYSENQLSFPEVVDRLRRFIALAVTARGRVVIGIDEMDKMESAKVAQKFLNEIKVIFGVDGCFYLVSISESAMSSFQRRGLPFRDVFDSSFDEVLSVESQTLAQSKALLRRRVVGLTPPLMSLCHCLSGGLPRDHLRVMRQFAVLAEEARRRHMKLKVLGVCRKAVAAELSRKLEAAAVSAREAAVEPKVSEILFWLRSLEPRKLDERELLALSSKPPEGWAPLPETTDVESDGATLERLRVEVSGYAYYLATVLQLFTETMEEEKFRELERGEGRGVSAIDRLAAARVAFGVNPNVATSMIDDFRRDRKWPTRDELKQPANKRNGQRKGQGRVTSVPTRRGSVDPPPVSSSTS
jgi:hypothetical protein